MSTARLAAVPRGGRPRSPEADRAIVDATLELIAEEGVTGLSVESVAVRAGVAKTTIYRRWSGKEDLVAEALATLNDDLEELPEGSAAGRATWMLNQMRVRSSESVAGRIFPKMAGYARTHPELWAAFHARVLEPRRERLRGILREGMASGELRADLDLELAVNLLVGGMVYTLNMRPPGLVVPDDYAERLVALALAGMGDR